MKINVDGTEYEISPLKGRVYEIKRGKKVFLEIDLDADTSGIGVTYYNTKDSAPTRGTYIHLNAIMEAIVMTYLPSEYDKYCKNYENHDLDLDPSVLTKSQRIVDIFVHLHDHCNSDAKLMGKLQAYYYLGNVTKEEKSTIVKAGTIISLFEIESLGWLVSEEKSEGVKESQ